MSEAKIMVRKRNFNETTVEEEPIIMNTEVIPEIDPTDNDDPAYENLLSTVQDLRNEK